MESKIPGWEKVKISEISLNVYAGATPNTKVTKYWENGNIPWMSSGEINNELIKFTNNFITQSGFDNSSTKMIPINSVLMALAGQGKTRGKVAINKIELCTNQSLAAIIPNQRVHYEYLYYFLQYSYPKLREISSGDGGRGGLNLKLIKEYELDLPPIKEQKKIAEILSTWDEAISALNKKLNYQKAYRTGLMKSLILRHYTSQKTHGNYIRLKKCLTTKNEIVSDRNIEPVSVGVYGMRLRSEIYDKELSSDYSKNKVIRENNICFGIGTNNIVYDVLLENKIYCVSPAYKVFGIDSIDPFYLKCYLDSFNKYYSKKYMIISARQGKSVDMDGLLNERIYVPSFEEQISFSKTIKAIDKYITILAKQVEVIQIQKKGLMQQLLTGKIRVNVN